MKIVIDETALKLFVAQMEALQCVVLALQSPGKPGEFADSLEYILERRLQGRADDDLTALGVARLLECLHPQRESKPPQLHLLQGGLSGQQKK